jgi:hypothetical protein
MANAIALVILRSNLFVLIMKRAKKATNIFVAFLVNDIETIEGFFHNFEIDLQENHGRDINTIEQVEEIVPE